MEHMERYNQWLADPSIDAETKAELQSIAADEKEIKERFYQELDFGTGGLRGIIGNGSNRLNTYTVGKATQGLANYINKEGTGAKGVAIAYDSRNMSPEFSEIAGLVLAANGIPAYVYPSLRPTPMLSFAVRHLGCTAGIVITASHNPPEYNGYKVYWEDGAQVVAPRDTGIIDEVNAVSDYGQIKRMDLDAAIAEKLYVVLDESVDEAFYENVLAQRVYPELAEKMGDDFGIVYTPIHGSGNIPVRECLEKAGYKNVSIVAEQELPDGNFTTVGYPNPEDPKVFALAQELAEKVGADVIVGTDPDCDRVGAMVKNDKGEYVVLTGNMVGALLTDYIISGKVAKGTMSANGAVISTIVSTELTTAICAKYGVEKMDVLTGFKFIGEKIKGFLETGSHEYLFGFEESYGCLAGTYARDKDAVVATLLICEMAAYYKEKSMTLYDGLQALYAEHGFFCEGVKSITLLGLDGVEKIKRIMASLRDNTPATFGGKDVVEARDYKNQVFQNLQTGAALDNTLPKSDVLYYTLTDDTWICVRPSGTEPKLKFYIGVKGETMADANAKIAAVEADLDEKIAAID
ncbi:phospho-sugar mutase [Chakrabartyella piscis]|uniref:phospho-sugar mutase n=1 Tax=Chakrabartyella piscis TaxID=2918914 RepID=UPI002958D82E|nr:phospho-sugar mutase [Chakrabartyella piscis]